MVRTTGNVNPAGQLRKMIEMVCADVFEAVPTESPSALALLANSPETEMAGKSALLDMLAGMESAIPGVLEPKIRYPELDALGEKHGWAERRSENSRYVTFVDVAPYTIRDNRFKMLPLREKAAFLMIFLDQMEQFDPSTKRKYVGMLDKYKEARRKQRKKMAAADEKLRSSGHHAIAHLADGVGADYDDHSPQDEYPEEERSGESCEVAFLTQKVTMLEGEMRQAAEKKAAETTLKKEKDKEYQISVKAAEDMLKLINPERKDLHPAALDEYKKALWPDQVGSR